MPFGVVYLAVALDGAVEGFPLPHQVLEQIGSGIPGVHEHGLVSDASVAHAGQHVVCMVELCLAVRLGGEDAVVDEPELVCVGIVVDTVDQADALDDAMRVARVLTPDQLYPVAVLLVEEGVVEEQVAFGAQGYLVPYPLPDHARRETARLEEILHVIMRQPSKV